MLDRQGRVLIPQNLREYAGLGEQVIVAGLNRHSEIWSHERWHEVLTSLDANGSVIAEQSGNPLYDRLGVDTTASDTQPGGNMEGKEARFGIVNSALWASATTAASNGSVNAMHDSFTPLGGLVPMFLMKLGEVIYGGVGSGLYGMLIFAIIAVFVAGLMVGRTPEYLKKKITAREMKLVSMYILATPTVVLVGASLAMGLAVARASILNTGSPHGFSEVLYAFTSAGNNNGSAFAGLSGNIPFYNTALGLVMLLGRFVPIVLALALAGSLAQQQPVPVTQGTLPTHKALFVTMLVGVVVIVTGLTYFPALTLGPLAEGL